MASMPTVAQEIFQLLFSVDEASMQNAERITRNLSSGIKKLLSGIGITIGTNELRKYTNECIQMASDVSEVSEKFNVVFGASQEEALNWADTQASNWSRSTYDIQKYMADLQNLLVGYTDYSDEARERMAGVTEEAVTLAMNLASFTNEDEATTMERVTTAMLGQTMAARKLGTNIQQAAVQEEMAIMGLEGKFKDLDEATKMEVRLRTMIRQSGDAMGDLKRSTDRYEAKTRSLNAALKDIKITIGNYLLPVYTKITEAKTILANKVRDLVINLTQFLDKCGTAVQVVATLGGAMLATWAIMNAGTVVALVNKLGKLGSAFLGARLKALLLFAGILLLALIVEDFIAFIQGRDSVIGELLDSAGVNVDEARKKFQDAAKTLSTVFEPVYEWCCNTMKAVGEGAADFWNEHGSEITHDIALVVDWMGNKFKNAAEDAKKAFSDFWDKLTGGKEVESGGVKQYLEDIYKWLKNRAPVFAGIVNTIGAVIGTIGQWIGSVIIFVVRVGSAIGKAIGKVVDAIMIGAEFVDYMVGMFTGGDDSGGNILVKLSDLARWALEGLGSAIGWIAGMIGDVLYGAILIGSGIVGFFAGAISGLTKFFSENAVALGILVAVLTAFAAIMLIANANTIAGAASHALLNVQIALQEAYLRIGIALETAWNAIKKVGLAIQTAFNFVMNIGNIGMVLLVAAIAAAIGVAVGLIKHFGGVKEAIQGVCDWIVGLWEKVKGFFGGLFGLGKDGGKDLADGVKEGIEEGVPGIEEAAGAAADAANTGLEDEAGTGEAQAAGAKKTDDYAAGIAAETPAAEEASSGVGSSVSTALADATQETIDSATEEALSSDTKLTDIFKTGTEDLYEQGLSGVDPETIAEAFGVGITGADSDITGEATTEALSEGIESVDASELGKSYQEMMADLMSGAPEGFDTSSLGDMSSIMGEDFDPTKYMGEDFDLSSMSTDFSDYSDFDMSSMSSLTGGVSEELMTALETMSQQITEAIGGVANQLTSYTTEILPGLLSPEFEELKTKLSEEIGARLADISMSLAEANSSLNVSKEKLSSLTMIATQIMVEFNKRIPATLSINLQLMQLTLQQIMLGVQDLSKTVQNHYSAANLGIPASVLYNLANSGGGASKSLSQNVSITNTFNGDTGYQKAASAAAQNANDTYAKLARGMAYTY